MDPASDAGAGERPVVMIYQRADITTFLDNRAQFGKLLADEHFIGLLSLIAKHVPVDPLFPRTCHFVMEPATGDAYLFQTVLAAAKDEMISYFGKDGVPTSPDNDQLATINSHIGALVSSFQGELRGISARAQYIKTFGNGVVQAAGLGREWSEPDNNKCWAVYAHLFR